MLGMYEFSLQKTHCHGQTRLVRIVADRPRPPAALRLQRPCIELAAHVCRLAGLGHSVRSIIGHSAIDVAPSPWISRGKASGSRTRSTMTFSPGPWQMWSNCGDRQHLVGRDGGVHAAGQHQAVRVDFLEDLRSFAPGGKV